MVFMLMPKPMLAMMSVVYLAASSLNSTDWLSAAFLLMYASNGLPQSNNVENIAFNLPDVKSGDI